MSGKRPSLADSMKRAAQPETVAVVASTPIPRPATPAKETPRLTSVPERTKPPGFYAATRAGKKKVTAAVDPTVHKQLKGLALARDTTTEALLLEAITDLFTKYRQPKDA
jgi:hypothetical protein